VFREPDFGQIPALREWLAGLPGPRVTEIGGREPDPGGTPAAPLAHLSNGELLGFSGATGEVYRSTPCPACGLPVRTLAEEPRLDLTEETAAGLMWVREADAWVAQVRLLEELAAAGLDSGLGSAPVTVRGAPSRLRLLYATVGLGLPAAPYGFPGDPCGVCGRAQVAGSTVPARPRYALYDTFQKPAVAADWMWSGLLHPGAPLVAGRVCEWLLGAGTLYADANGEERRDLQFIAAGWYPDEAERAFLPPPYQAQASAPQ
jgi:hypothetical protein